jgi:AcrR family transcriptional regulator
MQEKCYTAGMAEQATGLRERKKLQTRDALTRAALELFAERGYDDTTLAEIAEAAGVSTRTIFAYFPGKEDILFSTLQTMLGALAQALAERPAGTDTLTALREFVLSSEHEKTELDCRVGEVIAADPTLSIHKRARIAQLQEVLASAIADDLGVEPDDLRPQVAAASLAAAFEVLERQDRGLSTPPTNE